jgi:hypothetical protein
MFTEGEKKFWLLRTNDNIIEMKLCKYIYNVNHSLPIILVSILSTFYANNA